MRQMTRTSYTSSVYTISSMRDQQF